MNIWLLVAAATFLGLALAHSWIGERALLRPLFAQPWQIGLPRWVACSVLRAVWHLISLAWVAIAAVLALAAWGIAAVPVIALDLFAALALVSAAVMLVSLRGVHAAWAVFALGGVACLFGAHGWPSDGAVRLTAGALAAATLVAISALHVYWAAGGRWGRGVAVPTRSDGTPTMRPSALATVAVAVALAVTAVIIASASGLLPALPWSSWPTWTRDLGLLAAAVFGLRMIGDFRFAGLFKRERRSEFARWDSALFSPLCGALCLACAIAAAG